MCVKCLCITTHSGFSSTVFYTDNLCTYTEYVIGIIYPALLQQQSVFVYPAATSATTKSHESLKSVFNTFASTSVNI